MSTQKDAAAVEDQQGNEWPNKPLYPLARAFTEVISPFVIVAVILFVVAFTTDPHWLRSTIISVVPIAVIPQALSMYMTLRGTVTDKFIRHRQQRHIFYAMTLGSVLLGTVLVFIIPTSMELRWVSSLSVGTLLAVMLVNIRIKISIHALIAAVAAVILPVMTQSWIVLALSVLAWIGATWSRVYLERHQVVDVVLGSILGGLVGLAFLLLAGVLL